MSVEIIRHALDELVLAERALATMQREKDQFNYKADQSILLAKRDVEKKAAELKTTILRESSFVEA